MFFVRALACMLGLVLLAGIGQVQPLKPKPGPYPAGTALLYNASFEIASSSTTGRPDGWEMWDNTWSPATRQNQRAHGGSWAMHFTSDHYGAQSYVASKLVAVQPGHNYQASTYALAGQVTVEYWLAVNARWYDAAQQPLDEPTGEAFVPEDAWKLYAANLTAPSDAAYVSLEVGLTGSQNPNADLYLDDVNLAEAPASQ